MQDRFGPRTAGLCGSALLAIGFLSAGWWLPRPKAQSSAASCFSAPVGLGCAFLYPAVMSCAQKWYADRKGLATGVIGGAVGLSGAALTLLVRGFNSLFGIRTALCLLGAILGIVCGAGSLFLHNPPAPPQQKTAEDVSLKDMMKSKQYRLLFFITCLATPSVLLFSPKIVEMAQERGLSEAVGLSFVWAGSLSSAAGAAFYGGAFRPYWPPKNGLYFVCRSCRAFGFVFLGAGMVDACRVLPVDLLLFGRGRRFAQPCHRFIRTKASRDSLRLCFFRHEHRQLAISDCRKCISLANGTSLAGSRGGTRRFFAFAEIKTAAGGSAHLTVQQALLLPSIKTLETVEKLPPDSKRSQAVRGKRFGKGG